MTTDNWPFASINNRIYPACNHALFTKWHAKFKVEGGSGHVIWFRWFWHVTWEVLGHSHQIFTAFFACTLMGRHWGTYLPCIIIFAEEFYSIIMIKQRIIWLTCGAYFRRYLFVRPVFLVRVHIIFFLEIIEELVTFPKTYKHLLLVLGPIVCGRFRFPPHFSGFLRCTSLYPLFNNKQWRLFCTSVPAVTWSWHRLDVCVCRTREPPDPSTPVMFSAVFLWFWAIFYPLKGIYWLY